MPPNRRQYRNRIQIAADILEIAKDGSRKTRIMYLGNLSFDLVEKYLALLVHVGLIEIQDGGERTYVATEKGQRFLEDYHELKKHAGMADAKRRVLESNFAITP